MNSAQFLEHISSAPDMTVSVQKILKTFKEKNPTSLYGIVFNLRRKGYQITTPETGVYKLLSVETQDKPFSLGRVVGNRYTGKLRKNAVKVNVAYDPKQTIPNIDKKHSPVSPVLKAPKNCSILSPEDREDYLRLVKQSVYYGMCAEALLKANELQNTLRREMENA